MTQQLDQSDSWVYAATSSKYLLRDDANPSIHQAVNSHALDHNLTAMKLRIDTFALKSWESVLALQKKFGGNMGFVRKDILMGHH